MAIKSIEATGKTIEEAKRNALAQLGLGEDEVSMEVLDRGKTGLFGLFGASPQGPGQLRSGGGTGSTCRAARTTGSGQAESAGAPERP